MALTEKGGSTIKIWEILKRVGGEAPEKILSLGHEMRFRNSNGEGGGQDPFQKFAEDNCRSLIIAASLYLKPCCFLIHKT